MGHVSVHRSARAALLATIAAGSAIIIVSPASGVTATAAATPARTVSGRLLTRPRNTLATGSRIRASSLGIRTFTNGRNGFALADVGQAQYPAATVNGGTTWRTIGPALHINAAQAPLVVLNLGAANRNTIYAYGGGQVIDATTDGGRHWYQAVFDGLSMSVTRNVRGHLVGFIDGMPSGSSKGQTWQYVTENGGRTWRLDTTVGGS